MLDLPHESYAMYAKPHHVPGTHGKLPFAAIITVIAPTTRSEGSHLTGVQQHVAFVHQSGRYVKLHKLHKSWYLLGQCVFFWVGVIVS